MGASPKKVRCRIRCTLETGGGQGISRQQEAVPGVRHTGRETVAVLLGNQQPGQRLTVRTGQSAPEILRLSRMCE